MHEPPPPYSPSRVPEKETLFFAQSWCIRERFPGVCFSRHADQPTETHAKNAFRNSFVLLHVESYGQPIKKDFLSRKSINARVTPLVYVSLAMMICKKMRKAECLSPGIGKETPPQPTPQRRQPLQRRSRHTCRPAPGPPRRLSVPQSPAPQQRSHRKRSPDMGHMREQSPEHKPPGHHPRRAAAARVFRRAAVLPRAATAVPRMQILGTKWLSMLRSMNTFSESIRNCPAVCCMRGAEPLRLLRPWLTRIESSYFAISGGILPHQYGVAPVVA